MTTISDEEMNKIKKEVEKEFPYDEALQQIHIARRVISKEAKEKGMGFFEYMKLLEKQLIKSA